ncbi:MAG: site-specific integrase [Ilumatobacteraceae bacterium]|jgi:integrase
MSYIVQRNNRFYVVAYNGHDPITGRERRCWHPAGSDPDDAEAMQRRIDRQRPEPTCAASLGGFMSTTWLATKGTLTRATANRYRWMIDHNIAPRVGTIRLDALRPDDLDACYGDLIANGGRRRRGLSPKSVLEIHRVICNALDLAVDRQLIDANPARRARPPKRTNRSTVPAIWNAQQLGRFLAAASRLRLYPALHLAAHSGMRRGEVAGLNWGDLDIGASSLSIVRSRQATMGRTVEGPVKTRTSRRRIDLDPNAVELLQQWRHRLVTEGATLEPSTPMFLNTRHRTPSPESFSQLFGQIIATTDLPRIRFHDLRHTHASLLVAAGVPIKVVSERLGHANPGFTMHTYQHLLPGMGAAAASQFAALIDTSR